MKRLLLPSPVGPLLVEHSDAGVHAVRFWPGDAPPPPKTRAEPAAGDALGWQVVRELREYFAGERGDFTLPLAPAGTEFQRAVWAELCRIPCGATRSYAEVARALGRPGAARAVGQANARNPVPVVVPCHRVLASDGGIGGYLGDDAAGAGTALKRWLLGHERGMGNRRPSRLPPGGTGNGEPV